jgi:hypothetical protein
VVDSFAFSGSADAARTCLGGADRRGRTSGLIVRGRESISSVATDACLKIVLPGG